MLLVALAALAAVLGAIAVCDARTFTIPNKLVLALAAIWLTLVCAMAFQWLPAAGGLEGAVAFAARGLTSAVAVGGGVLLFSVAFEALTGRYSMAGGDLKLIFACSLFMGWEAALFMVGSSCVLGSIMQLVLPKRLVTYEPAVASESSQVARVFPLGPAICICGFAFIAVSLLG